MKILHLLFRDFLRKLVAVAFAVVIYFSVRSSGEGGAGSAAGIQSVSRVCPVEILDLGADRCVVFPDGSKPEVNVTFRGAGKVLARMKEDDVLFYVVAPKVLEPGEHTLPVRCYSSLPKIEVDSVKPKTMKVSVVEIPVENHK